MKKLGFGEKLREAREAKGYSLDYIEEETKIRKLYIEALEQETFDLLPPKVYATGFVRRSRYRLRFVIEMTERNNKNA